MKQEAKRKALDDNDTLRYLAAQVAAMATAITGLDVEQNPTEKELFGMWLILTDISKKLSFLAEGETENE